METAGREWAAKKVRDWSAISNCYSIETVYDICSDEMEKRIRDNRLLAPFESINFAKAFTMPASRQMHSVPRWRRMQKLISSHSEALSLEDVKKVFRDHYDDEILSPRFGACYANFMTICMHAQEINGSQTAASMIFTFDETLGPILYYAPSLPCCSVYIPIYWTESIPITMSHAGRYYDKESLWWSVEKLSMAVSVDEVRFGKQVRNELRKLELEMKSRILKTEETAKDMLKADKEKEANTLLCALTEQSADLLLKLSNELGEKICSVIRSKGGLYGQRKQFLEKYCDWARMPLT